MKVFEFQHIPEYVDLSLVTLNVGDKFLTGNRVIQQKEEKSSGQGITYYEVVSIGDNGNVSYVSRYDTLES